MGGRVLLVGALLLCLTAGVALPPRFRGEDGVQRHLEAQSDSYSAQLMWTNDAMGDDYDSSEAYDYGYRNTSDDDDYDDSDDNHSNLQLVLGLSLGGAIVVVTLGFTWRAWLDCCIPSNRTPRHRAFQRQSASAWKCAVCLHTNDELQSSCVLCGSIRQEEERNTENTAATDAKDSNLDQLEAQIDTDMSATTSHFFLLASPVGSSRRNFQDKQYLASQLSRHHSLSLAPSDRQQVAIDRHGWKRSLGGGRVRWVRLTYDTIKENPALQGTIILAKNIPQTYRRPRMRRPSSSAASFLSQESSFVVSDSSAMEMFVLTPGTGFVRDNERGNVAVWKLAEEVVITKRKYSRDMMRISGSTFAEKAKWIYQYSLKTCSSIVDGFYTMHIHRESVLDESVQLLSKSSAMMLRRRLRVDFVDEPGIDGGGILREWMQLLCQEIFKESRGLFVTTNSAYHHGYWINRNGGRSPERMEMFHFFGKILGKAVLEGLLLSVRLSIPLLKHILGAPFGVGDLQLIDETVYSSLVWILENDNTNSLGLNFTIEGHQLIPNGNNVFLHDGNKHVYVAKVLQYYLCDSVDAEVASLLAGLRSVIDDTVLHVFDYKELELFLSGLPDIDVADWKAHTDVRTLGGQFPDREALVVDWFWEIVESFSQQERSRLLQYVTGSTGVPVEGFKGLTGMDGDIQRFTIQLGKAPSNDYSSLPHASTCLNRLDLPVYSTREELDEVLRMVIQMDVTGFSSR